MANAKRPIICFPAIDWHFLYHRPQQLMLRLARAGHPVHYRNIAQVPGTPPEEVAANLWVYRDFDRLPGDIAKPIYFVYFPAHAAWLQPADDKFVIYDCIDDDPVFDGHEELMLSRADMVLCVSRALMKKHEGKHPRLLLLANGVDLNHYTPSGGATPPEMSQIREKGEAVIGFTGAFYTGWVDAELFYFLAESRPEWQFVVIGHAYHWDFSGAPPNLSHLGQRPYDILPSYVRCFDAGIIPFVDNRIARGADPVKLYEYLAAGLPVVSRNLPFIEGLAPPLVYSYNTGEECLAAIARALADEKEKRDEALRLRLAYASGCSWDVRINLLLTELRKLTFLEI